jgi:8-oxo-dGTP pyrophosphatase MutT (NUDIX family)
MTQEPEQQKHAKKRTRRPRDAATLILYRRTPDSFEVLMGERHGGHAFMPNRFVFPGGAVSRGDGRVRTAGTILPAVRDRLEKAATPARARALAAAAIRETFEETGLVLGRPDPDPGKPVPKDWTEFFALGDAPAVDDLEYVARAVTPAFRPRRFNARFFIADGSKVDGRIKGDGELINVHWVSLANARKLEIPLITRVVLGHVEDYLMYPDKHPAERPVPFYTMRHGRRVIGED